MHTYLDFLFLSLVSSPQSGSIMSGFVWWQVFGLIELKQKIYSICLFLKWRHSSVLNGKYVFQVSIIFGFMTWRVLQIILMHDQNQLEVINWEKVALELCSKATSMAEMWPSRSSLLWVVLGSFLFDDCVLVYLWKVLNDIIQKVSPR